MLPHTKLDYCFPAILLSNTNALTNKTDELEGMLHFNDLDVAAITETWVSDSIPEQCLQISNCNMWQKPRVGHKGGGVALYINKSIPVQALKVDIPGNLKVLWLLVKPNRLPREVSCLILAMMYNPPKSASEDDLLDHLSKQCDTAEREVS